MNLPNMKSKPMPAIRRHPSLAILMRLALGTATINIPAAVHAEDPKPPDFSNDEEIRGVLREIALLEAQNKLDAAKASRLDVLTQLATLEANLATSEATVATSNKLADEAAFGSRLTPLPGTVTTTTNAEAMVIVNNQMDQIARQIAADLSAKKSISTSAAITLIPGDAGTSLQAGIRAYGQILSELKTISGALNNAELEKFLKDQTTPKPAGQNKAMALAGAASAIQAGLSLAALARVNRTFTPAEVKVEDMSVVSALAGHLLQARVLEPETAGGSPKDGLPVRMIQGTSPRFRKVYSVGLFGEAEELVTQINSLAGKVSGARALISELDSMEKGLSGTVTAVEKKNAAVSGVVADLATKMAVLNAIVEHYQKIVDGGGGAGNEKDGAKEVDPALELAKARAELEAVRKRHEAAVGEQGGTEVALKAAQDALANFQAGYKKAKASIVESLGKAEEYLKAIVAGTIGGVKLEDLMKAGAIQSRLAGESYLVFVHVNSTAGTNLARQTILTNSFRVAGGASVSYHAVRKDFSTVAAATYYDYDGFFKVSDRSIGGLPGNLPNNEPIVPAREPRRKNLFGHPNRR